MKNLLTLLVLLTYQLNQAAHATDNFINNFFGGPNLAIGFFNGNLDGFVATKAGSVPIEYRNEAGELECHILLRKTGQEWNSSGDIGSINGGTSCPLVLGGTNPIRAVEAFGTDICIGGDFVDLGGISGLSYFACYSNSLGWYQPNGIGNGPNNSVYSIDSNGLSLFLGGAFNTVNNGTLSAKHVVKTDGLFWEPLYTDDQQTDNGVGSTVQTVYSTTSFLVVQSGTSTLTWNPSVPEWKNRGGHNGSAAGRPDVVIFGSTLTVSTPGASNVSGDPGGSVSEFNIGAEEWSEFGMSEGVNTGFAQLAYGLGPLYSTGDFTAFDPNARGLAWFNSVTWAAAPMYELLGDLNLSQVFDMQQGGNEFCLQIQGLPGDSQIHWNSLACYNLTTWTGDNQAPNSNIIQTMAEYENRIIHGGDFIAAGDQFSSYVAKLSVNNKWKAISQLDWTGPGAGSVSNLQVYAGDLYATGTFNMANGSAVEGVAKYDGTNWSPVIAGLNAFNGLMTVWNNKLIITGSYNGSTNPILSWDGNVVEEVGSFTAGGILTDLVDYQGDLVVSNLASGTARLHAYDGASWQNFGGTAQGVFNTLEVDGDKLYVGGDFTGACNTVDFVAAENIYVWDGFGCDDMGGGVTNTGPLIGVDDMVIYGNGVIATGRFTQAGGTPANSIAIWNGNNWIPMGLGLVDGEDEGQGNALWIKDNTLYVAGYFEQAGRVLSHNFAAADLDAVFSNGFE
ncbi:MAG: hypothetical protein ACSHWU_00750 [Marinicella sp.]